MVELATRQQEVAGARMMGGGFRGSAVNLVATNSLHQFHRSVSEDYCSATGILPGIFPVQADDGVREIG